MRRILRWAGIFVVGIIVLIGAAAAVVYLVTNARMSATYSFMPADLTVQTDSASTARGEHLATVRGCIVCHGADLGGAPVIEVPPVAMLYASNLTSGMGGKAKLYTRDVYWVRAIRHGIGIDNEPLILMPAQEYQVLSDQDAADIIAFVKSRDPVDRELPQTTVGPLARLLYLAGQLELLPAELVDHESVRPARRIEATPTAEYGAYLVTGCFGCHGNGLSGGPIPGAPPDWPPALNLTPDPEAGLGRWTEEDFFRALREGVHPDGRIVK